MGDEGMNQDTPKTEISVSGSLKKMSGHTDGESETDRKLRMGDSIINRNIRISGSMKFGAVLVIIAVLASAMAVLFVLHDETDSSSAEITDCGWCGQNAMYYIYYDGTLRIDGAGALYDYDQTPAPWYEHRSGIDKVVIGDGITYLGMSAFSGCWNIRELTIPITLNSVLSDDEDHVFEGCYYVEKIHFTCGKDGYGCNYSAYPGNNSWYQYTPWYQSRDVLKEIDFADGIIHIGNDAFRELNIKAVNLPQTVTSLGNHCFFDCTKFTDLTIPVSLNSYGNEDYPAFDGCTAVQKVTFTRGNGVPFDYSNWLGMKNARLAPWNMKTEITKTIIISDDVTKLGEYMFFYCRIGELSIPISFVQSTSSPAFFKSNDHIVKITVTKGSGTGPDYSGPNTRQYNPWNDAIRLKQFIVGEGVTYLGEETFYNCKAEIVVLPNSLKSAGELAFAHAQITYLTLPISLNVVGVNNYAIFKDVSGIEKITFTPGTGDGPDYSTDKFVNSWYQLTPWYQCRGTLKEFVFEEGVNYIGAHAFETFMLFDHESHPLLHEAQYLSGHSFVGENSILYMNDSGSDASQDVSSSDGCCIEAVPCPVMKSELIGGRCAEI